METRTPPPTTPPGMLSSIVLPPGRGITDPGGSRFDAVCAPLRICRRTGTVGGIKVAPLTVKRKVVCMKKDYR